MLKGFEETTGAGAPWVAFLEARLCTWASLQAAARLRAPRRARRRRWRTRLSYAIIVHFRERGRQGRAAAAHEGSDYEFISDAPLEGLARPPCVPWVHPTARADAINETLRMKLVRGVIEPGWKPLRRALARPEGPWPRVPANLCNALVDPPLLSVAFRARSPPRRDPWVSLPS